jgi:hypothetical protein
VVEGDWDKVYAATLVSTRRIEAAILGKDDETDGRLVVRITTINDRDGELVAERIGPQSDEPQEIRLTARIGLFGDPEHEDRLIRAVAWRLRRLAGKGWSPLGD